MVLVLVSVERGGGELVVVPEVELAEEPVPDEVSEVVGVLDEVSPLFVGEGGGELEACEPVSDGPEDGGGGFEGGGGEEGGGDVVGGGELGGGDEGGGVGDAGGDAEVVSEVVSGGAEVMPDAGSPEDSVEANGEEESAFVLVDGGSEDGADNETGANDDKVEDGLDEGADILGEDTAGDVAAATADEDCDDCDDDMVHRKEEEKEKKRKRKRDKGVKRLGAGTSGESGGEVEGGEKGRCQERGEWLYASWIFLFFLLICRFPVPSAR